jgi:hypothetical protein
MANVTEMPPPETLETQEIQNSPVETPPSPPTPASSGKKPPPTPPKKGVPRPDPPFFERVAAVPKSDWGSRAYMYVYADEPVCNPKTFGTTRYMLKSSVPILDLEGLKQDYGSFKGWMSLNLRKTGKDQTDEIDRFDFEIYDPKHPPKIPKSAWANDPRNKKWLDLLPPEKPAPSDAAGTMLDAMKVYKEIRNEVKDEMPEPAAPTDSTRSTLETMLMAKQLFAPPAPVAAAPVADPFDTAKKVMDMRANDPMITLLLARMEAQDKALEAARDREFQLLKESKTEKTAPKGFFESLIDFGGEAVKTRLLDSVLGGAKTATETITRAGRMNTLEFVSENLPKTLDTFAPLIQAFAHKVMNPGNGTTNPGAAIQPAVTGDVFQKFINEIVTPKMMLYFRADPSEEGGQSFADWIYSGFPEHFSRLQAFQHPMMPGLQGEAAILTAYKNTPQVWSQLGPHEAAFNKFVHGFCSWDPNAPDEGEDPTIIDAEVDGPEDLDTEETVQ